VHHSKFPTQTATAYSQAVLVGMKTLHIIGAKNVKETFARIKLDFSSKKALLSSKI
jgi:hypothetical protein